MLTRQQFLTQHKTFASLQGDSDRVRLFLQNHPDIAQAWAAIVAAERAPAPGNTTTTTTTTGGGDTPPGLTPEQVEANGSASAYISGQLGAWGLESLGESAWQRHLSGVPTSVIFQDIRSNAPWTNGAYANRFLGMAALAKKGRAISEDAYIANERQYAQTLRAFGLPAQFYDSPEDFATLIGGEVSAQEFNDRLQARALAVGTSPDAQRMRDELGRLYGLANADSLTLAYWINPDIGSDIIKKQALAAQTAAASTASGFGQITKDQAELISGAGVTGDQARQGFTQLAGLHELGTGLVGDAGDQGVSRDELIGAQFTGDAAAQEKVKKATRRRTAVNDAGGGYAAGQGGVSGLGSAAN